MFDKMSRINEYGIKRPIRKEKYLDQLLICSKNDLLLIILMFIDDQESRMS